MTDLHGKRLLILGGSHMSIEIVNAARALGVYSIVTDWYDTDKSPAKLLADEYHDISFADEEKIVELIRERKIDGVITGYTDSALHNYASICAKAGLPRYGDCNQISVLTSKRLYKALCRKFRVPVIQDFNISTDLNEIPKDVIYPVLVKPSDGSGAVGISICNQERHLSEAIDRALCTSKLKEVVVENYVPGHEITVFYYFEKGRAYLTAVADRYLIHQNQSHIGLPVAYYFPSKQTARYIEKVNDNVVAMFESIGIHDGMMFLQCMVADEIYIYDIGFRLTGTFEYKLIEALDGYNPINLLIEYALCGELTNSPLEEKVSVFHGGQKACNITFLSKPGRIGSISGIEEIINIPGVIDATLNCSIGDVICQSAVGTLNQVVSRVFVVTKEKDRMIEIAKEVHSKLRISSEAGEDMLLPNFDFSKI